MVINGTVDGFYEDMWHANKNKSLHEMLEDGTPAFHNIAALNTAFKVHRRLFGSMTSVAKHTCSLIQRLYEPMSVLSHADGLPVCRIYKDSFSQYGDSRAQGPTIAFNVCDNKGNWIGKTEFERLAILNNIQIRTGGVCNPGGIASALRISPKEMRENFAEGMRCGNDMDEMNGKPTGIVRVSLGAMSSARDVDTFIRFLHTFVDTGLEDARPLHSLNLIGATDVSSLSKRGDRTILSAAARVERDYPLVSTVREKGTGSYLGSRSWRHHWKS